MCVDKIMTNIKFLGTYTTVGEDERLAADATACVVWAPTLEEL